MNFPGMCFQRLLLVSPLLSARGHGSVSGHSARSPSSWGSVPFTVRTEVTGPPVAALDGPQAAAVPGRARPLQQPRVGPLTRLFAAVCGLAVAP